jgi:hypothetical protein
MSKKKAEALPPKSATKTFAVIKEIIDRNWINIPPERSFNGNAAPGDFLESLFDGKKNNRDSPDLNDWEVKFHGGNALITLFHKEPQPRGINNFLVREYGWKMEDNEYGNISFRHTLSGKSKRGFYVKNDLDRVWVKHDRKDNPCPYWTHNTLLNAAGAKLRRLILVEGEYQQHPLKRVKYKSATAFWDFNLMGFCEALERGIVSIDFDARTSKGPTTAIRNHGTKFRVSLDNIGSLYMFSKKIT